MPRDTRRTPPPPPVEVDESAPPSVNTSADIALPPRAPRRDVDVGVKGVRRSEAREARRDVKKLLKAEEAGDLSTRFRKGGRAFAQWLATEGIDATPRTAAAWDPVLEQFASAPVHGHRRGTTGGNHRAR